jgi:hypothetical protein
VPIVANGTFGNRFLLGHARDGTHTGRLVEGLPVAQALLRVPVQARRVVAALDVLELLERLLVEVPQVEPVDVVLDVELPVATQWDLAALDLDELVPGVVARVLGQVAEPLGERRARGGVGMHEHEPGPRLDRDVEETELVGLEVGELGLALRDPPELALEAPFPSVIGAAQRLAAVAAAARDHHPAVTADVEEPAWRAVGRAHDHDGLGAHGRGEVVARLAQLAHMADKVPRAPEELAALALVPLGVVIRRRWQPIHRPFGDVGAIEHIGHRGAPRCRGRESGRRGTPLMRRG